MTYGGSRRVGSGRSGCVAVSARSRAGSAQPETVLACDARRARVARSGEIGELVVTAAVEWFKAPACGVFAADLDGQVAPLAVAGSATTLVAGGA